jgi:Cu(I)/Ag(I) efflux system membrane fusion protein
MSRNSVVLLLAVTAAAGATGYWIGHSSKPPAMTEHPSAATPETAQQVYTCSMHPQVRLDHPGKCPICEMPLIPATALPAQPGGEPMLQLSDHALAMASVETAPVERRAVARELRTVGKVEYNESSLATITARVDGYAERLFVNFTGVELKAGDHLAEIYSPELLVAQQELLIARQSSAGGTGGALIEASKLKLRRLGLTEEQIRDLLENNNIADRVTLISPSAGTVIEKSAVQNSAFRAGDVLYRVANLDTVWVYLDIYEYDLAWVRYGQKVAISAEALPGREFEGLVTFVQPMVSEETRTVRVPVHVENADRALKPGMFVSAIIRSALDAEGMAAPTGVEGKFSCPMHPQVLRDEGGPCPVCEMPMGLIPGQPSSELAFACPMQCEEGRTYAAEGNCPVCDMQLEAVVPPGSGLLVIPTSAVLDSGTRRIVYVEKSRGLFEPREIVLGPRAGEIFPVLRGLSEGERVVTRGGFLIDSQFQITGHPSLFYPGGLMAGSAGHQHGGAQPTAAPPAADAEHKH